MYILPDRWHNGESDQEVASEADGKKVKRLPAKGGRQNKFRDPADPQQCTYVFESSILP